MEIYNRQLKEKLLPILRCTMCCNENLMLSNDAIEFNLPIPLHSECIKCVNCNTYFPITDDFIPLMWSSSLKNYFLGEGNLTNLVANIKIYDNTSDKYKIYVRQEADITLRIRNAINKILSFDTNRTYYHLDFGCGPGHVLGGLQNQYLNQIGLDVSINNLRNTRARTKALVVCGDASNMPFSDKVFDFVTESSVLHHIMDWKSVIMETCRVCNDTGGIVIDSEPTKEGVAWSSLAVAVFNLRFPIYKILSFIKPEFYMFRDTKQAKLNLLAEIHHQPNTGFCLEELRNTFSVSGFNVDIILSPTTELQSKPNPSWKYIILHLLSGHNPWDVKYDGFMAIAKSKKRKVNEGF